MLHEHHDQVDKELDAVIMVQSVWRSKIEHRKYLSVVHDNRGAKEAIEERCARELKIWNVSMIMRSWHEAAGSLGFAGRRIYADMKRQMLNEGL